MDFDLKTAFAVKEREDGLLEKDNFDLSTAKPIAEIRATKPGEFGYTPPLTEAQKAQSVVSQVYGGYKNVPAMTKADWILTSPQAQAATGAVVTTAVTGGLNIAVQGIKGAAEKGGAGSLIDKIFKGIVYPEATQNLFKQLPGTENLPKWAEITAGVAEDIALYGATALTISKTKSMLLLKDINRKIDTAATEYAKTQMKDFLPSGKVTEEKVFENLKTQFKADFLKKATAAEAELIVSETAIGEGQVSRSSLLQEYAGRRSLLGLVIEDIQHTEAGILRIPKVGQTVSFKNPQGELLSGVIKKVAGEVAEIELTNQPGRIIVATLRQLDLPVELLKEQILETEPQVSPKETQPQIPIPPETPIVPLESPLELSVPPEDDSVKRVIQALKEAKPIRAEQEALMKAERGKRIAKAKAMGEKIGGEAGFQAQLGSLKGKLPKAQFESLRGKLDQPTIDSLFNKIRQSEMNDWDKIGAQTGLGKLFGEYGGEVPTEGELKLLNDIFGKEFTDALVANRTFLQKFMLTAEQALNVPRSIMASFDLSAPLRQGAFMIGRPKQFIPAFGEMFKFFGSEKALTELSKNIASRPTYELMREHGLALTDLGTGLTEREERFMSNLAEKIPGIGKIVRASGRAYTGFLNKLRADVFDDLYNKAKFLGIKETDKLSDDLVEFINAATGRGNLPGKLENAAVALNSVFFSPRLMASRLSLLNPMFYISKEPFVRKEALKSLFTFASVVFTILGLAALAGMEVGMDWRSSDFAKIKIGNTRIDIMAGFQQYLRMAGQLITGEYVSSVTGKVITLGEGYKPLTRFDIILRQLENKEAPVASFITSLLRQQTFMGEEFSVTKEIRERFTPMVLSDLVEMATSSPELLPLGLLGLFGVGVQTYETKSRLSPIGLSRTKRGLR